MNCLPSQYARTPSSFSLIHQPVTVVTLSHVSASSKGGGVLPSAPSGTRGASSPTEASLNCSAASPRSLRMCLQVRRRGSSDWLRHAGQVHDQPPSPQFLMM